MAAPTIEDNNKKPINFGFCDLVQRLIFLGYNAITNFIKGMHYMKKILWMIATCLTLTACGEDVVRIDDRGVFFFGSLQIKELSKTKPFTYAGIMLSDAKGSGDFSSVTLTVNREKNESKCLPDTAIFLNGNELRTISVKSEINDEKTISYSAKYSFDDYLEFFAKNNKVMISSCGINHVLTEDEKGGLARIAKAWIKFTNKAS